MLFGSLKLAGWPNNVDMDDVDEKFYTYMKHLHAWV